MIISFALFTRLLPSAYRQSPVTPGDQLCLLRIPTHIYFRLVRIKDTIIFFLSLSLTQFFFISLSPLSLPLSLSIVLNLHEKSLGGETGARREHQGLPPSPPLTGIGSDKSFSYAYTPVVVPRFRLPSGRPRQLRSAARESSPWTQDVVVRSRHFVVVVFVLLHFALLSSRPPSLLILRRPSSFSPSSSASFLVLLLLVSAALVRKGRPVDRGSYGRQDLLVVLLPNGDRRVVVQPLCHQLQRQRVLLACGLLGNGQKLDQRYARGILHADNGTRVMRY